jgi:hypothetical protein
MWRVLAPRDAADNCNVHSRCFWSVLHSKYARASWRRKWPVETGVSLYGNVYPRTFAELLGGLYRYFFDRNGVQLVDYVDSNDRGSISRAFLLHFHLLA